MLTATKPASSVPAPIEVDGPITRATLERHLDSLHWPWDAGLSALIDEAVAYEDAHP